MKLVYINIGRSSVFESQVLALLKYYADNNVFDEVILLFGYQKEEDVRWLKDKPDNNISIHFFKVYPNYVFYNYQNQRSLFKTILKLDKSFEDYFFHIRTELTSYMFKKIVKNLKIEHAQILTDVRGASLQEVKEYYSTKSLLKPFKLMNYHFSLKNLEKDKNISVVSKSLQDYILSSVKISKNVVRINPCLISEDFYFNQDKRRLIRSELNLKNSDILLVFTSGGVAKWQNNDMILQLAELNFKILNLSKINILHPNIINKFVPYSEVPWYLSAADVSFIWRDSSVVNKVASPVKVSEYISCGLPIIHNGTVDMIGNLLDDPNESLQIERIEELSFSVVEKLVKNNNRKELSEKGLAHFGLRSIANGYQKIYNN